MKRKLCLFFVLLFCLAQSSFLALAEGAADEYLKPGNWNSLSGYTYVGKSDSGVRNPAQLEFGTAGIRFRSNGFYKVGVREYSGILFHEKLDASDFSVDIRIDRLGGTSNNNDDAWLGVGFLDQNKGFDSIAPDYNKGCLALLRPSNRSVTAFVHENTVEGKTAHKFDDTISAQGYLSLKKTEGATVRIRFEKKTDGYEISVQDVGTEGSRPVVLTGSLYYPDTYLENDRGYFFLSTSTDSGGTWDVTVKSINGVRIGTDDGTQEKLTPEEEVETLFGFIASADLESKVNGNAVTLADEDMIAAFTELVESLSAEAKVILNNDPDVADEYGSGDALLAELASLLERANEALGTLIAKEEVDACSAALAALPADAGEISLADANRLLNAEQKYRNLSERARELMGDGYAAAGERLAALRSALNAKQAAEVSELLAALGKEVTAENAEEDLYRLALAQARYELLSEESRALVVNPALLETKRVQFDDYRAGLSAEEAKTFSGLERLAEVNVLIALLPVRAEVRLEDESAVQRARTEYFGLSSALRGSIKDLARLEDAEAELASLRIALIPAIGNITADYEDVIMAARNAYVGLEPGAKARVSAADAEKVTSAYEKLQALLNGGGDGGDDGDHNGEETPGGCACGTAGFGGGAGGALLMGALALCGSTICRRRGEEK